VRDVRINDQKVGLLQVVWQAALALTIAPVRPAKWGLAEMSAGA